MGYYIIFLVMALSMFGVLAFVYRNNDSVPYGMTIGYSFLAFVLPCLVIFELSTVRAPDTENELEG